MTSLSGIHIKYQITLFIILLFTSFSCLSDKHRDITIPGTDKELVEKITKKWKDCNLQKYIPFDIFRSAMTGYYKIESLKKKNILTIIDYSKPSTEKRFFVIDLDRDTLLYRCYVAHGRNTGNNHAKKFSNAPGSKKSCLGFFLTVGTYKGKHGYSLKLKGLEKDINDNAETRAIVIHGAHYVSKEFIKDYGRLGRSWGCPALPGELSTKIIDEIKGGSCLFIYGNDRNYFLNSDYFNK